MIKKNKLSSSECPSFLCKSINIIQVKKQSYHHDEPIYKCRECKTEWNEDTMYCLKCLDVAKYCDCYE